MTLATEAQKISTTARNGAWTPWALVLCVECDYVALKDSPRAEHYAKHLAIVSALDRTALVERPEGEFLGVCNTCHCACWVRGDVGLLQHVGLKTSELDWEGPFGWHLEQTGGMCVALVFTTEGREIVVTAMDSEFFVGEYSAANEDERWMNAARTWQSASLYDGGELKDAGMLDAMVEECARQVIAFIHSTPPSEVVS